MTDEIIYVCQIPECGYQADTWDKDGHDYFYCPDHAAELGWCVECHQYVTPDGIYTYDMCADCLEAVPEDYAAIADAIDDVLANEPQCPHCGSTQITEVTDSEGGGYCHACENMFDAAVTGDG